MTSTPTIAAIPMSLRMMQIDEILLESYVYPPAPAGKSTLDVHACYQVCFSLNFPGRYHLRDDMHPVPVEAVSIIYPGEVHWSSDPFDRVYPSRFLVAYIPAVTFQRIVLNPDEQRPVCDPMFRERVVLDRDIAGSLRGLAHAMAVGDDRLAHDVLLREALALLVRRHGTIPQEEARQATPSPVAAAVAREYLHAHVERRVTLDELATVAGASPWSLIRTFRELTGVPPHRYQVAVRVDRARALLAEGYPPAMVAVMTGFADQSHLTRHFVRHVGIGPGQYQRSGSARTYKTMR